MRGAIGKFGLVAVGAIAAITLVTGNSQTANAQLELEVLTPTVSADTNNSGLYTWTYFVQLADTGGSTYNVELSNNQSVVGSSSPITSQFTISDFAGYQAGAQSKLQTYGYR